LVIIQTKTLGGTDMKTMPLSEVKTKLSELVDAVERDEVVTITRNGKPVAIIVSKDEYEGWQETVEIMRDAKFMKEIRKGIQSSAIPSMSSSPTELSDAGSQPQSVDGSP